MALLTIFRLLLIRFLTWWMTHEIDIVVAESWKCFSPDLVTRRDLEEGNKKEEKTLEELKLRVIEEAFTSSRSQACCRSLSSVWRSERNWKFWVSKRRKSRAINEKTLEFVELSLCLFVVVAFPSDQVWSLDMFSATFRFKKNRSSAEETRVQWERWWWLEPKRYLFSRWLFWNVQFF